MTKHVVTLIAIGLLALPAAAIGATPSGAASASCKAQLKAAGTMANFLQVNHYKSFGGCVSHTAKLNAQQRQTLLSAEKQCRSQQLANASAFDAKYGTSGKAGKNSDHANSFGKCVSSLAPV
jgi:hypothetical protein